MKEAGQTVASPGERKWPTVTRETMIREKHRWVYEKIKDKEYHGLAVFFLGKA